MITTETKYVLLSVLIFADETFRATPLHVGTRESCETVASKITAVCNSTGKRVVESFAQVVTEREWRDLQRDLTAGAEG